MSAASVLTQPPLHVPRAWHAAQQAERGYWYPDDPALFADRRAEERARQAWYAGLLLIESIAASSVLELGAGPHGLLTRAERLGARRLVAVEPMALRSDDARRYAERGVELRQTPAEALETQSDERFEEVWLTNVLQHVVDPAVVLHVATGRATHRVRLFEWIDEPVSVVHLHTITAALIRAAFADWACEFETEGRATSDRGWSQRFLAVVYRQRRAA